MASVIIRADGLAFRSSPGLHRPFSGRSGKLLATATRLRLITQTRTAGTRLPAVLSTMAWGQARTVVEKELVLRSLWEFEVNRRWASHQSLAGWESGSPLW